MKQEIKSESFDGSVAVLEKSREKSKVLGIPACIILNAQGVSFFLSHDKSMHRFEDSEGTSRFGFFMKTIDMAWLKKMLLRGFIEKIEIEILEIARSSDILSDAVRLIFFSMFRHRFNLFVMDYIYNSPILRAWNRANPKHSIGPEVNISKQAVKTALVPLEVEVSQIQQQVRGFIENQLHTVRSKWDDEDKLNLFVDEIIRDLDLLVYFILVGSKEFDRGDLIKNIASQIIAFAGMVDALDMASMLSVELASAAERSAHLRVKTQKNYNSIIREIPQLKQNMRESKFRGTTIVISIPRYVRKKTERQKFRLSFFNDATDAKTERRFMEDFTERNGRFSRRKKLEDYFHKEGPSEDNAMRFYYLTVLRQLCDRHNILMDLSINAVQNSIQDLPGKNSEASVTNLSFGI